MSSSPCFIANTPAGVSVNAVGVDIRPLGIANLEYGEKRLRRLCTQRTGLQEALVLSICPRTMHSL